MVKNIPSEADYYDAGKELLDFSWDIVLTLLKNLDEAEYFGTDPIEISETYWTAAKRHLTTALSITQQGVEFILKGKICAISPFLLLADPPIKWPSIDENKSIDFSNFRTLDANDLIKVHDTFSVEKLDPIFINKFHNLRERRNIIMHSVSKKFEIQVKDVIDSLLYMHKTLFPSEQWIQLRHEFLKTSPNIQLGTHDYVVNATSWEAHLALNLLDPAQVKMYFGIDKKQRRYFCPECFTNANTDDGFEHKLALLRPKGENSTKLFCLLCDKTHDVVREACENKKCLGNVISDTGLCLTCLY